MEQEYKPFEIEVNALGFYVNRAYSMMVKLLNKELQNTKIDIQHTEFSILKILNEIKGASQSQIAALLGKERSGISRTLVSLESKGYINREPLDKKTNYVTLTEKGKQIIPLINEVADRVTNLAFKGFPNKSRTSIISNLTKIYQNALQNSK